MSSAGVHRGTGQGGHLAQVGRDLCPQRGLGMLLCPSLPGSALQTGSTFNRREMISDYSDQCWKTVTRGYEATVHKIPAEIITLKVLPFQLF